MKVKNTDTGRILDISEARYEEWYKGKRHLQPIAEEGDAKPKEDLDEDLSAMTVADLRKMAAEMDVEYVGLVKADLVDAIEEAMGA